MRRSWRRFLKRRQKLFIALSLFSLANIIYPQHAAALSVEQERNGSGVAVEQAPEMFVSAGEANLILPTVDPLPAKQILFVVATAYSSSFDETDGDPFTTASGARVRHGVVAANGLPFGTKLRIPDVYGDTVFTVLDRMSSRYEKNRIDLWMSTKQQAKQWGVKYIKMEVL